MKLGICFSSIFLFFSLFLQAELSGQFFNKAAFYEALASEKLEDINSQLSLLNNNPLPEKEAYEGVLLMRKSGLVSGTKEKLSLFKLGRQKLESAINKDKSSVEYRFLRVIIQENAPKIVKYRTELEQDCRLIKENFKGLSTMLQQAIADYSKKSKALKIS